MAFDSMRLSAGTGGGETLQFFTYNSAEDTKSVISNIAYWVREDGTSLADTLVKDGAMVFYTSKAGGDNATEMGIRWFDPAVTGASTSGGELTTIAIPPEPIVVTPPEPIVVTPPEPTSIFEPGGLGNMFGRNK